MNNIKLKYKRTIYAGHEVTRMELYKEAKTLTTVYHMPAKDWEWREVAAKFFMAHTADWEVYKAYPNSIVKELSVGAIQYQSENDCYILEGIFPFCMDFGHLDYTSSVEFDITINYRFDKLHHASKEEFENFWL